MSEKIYDVAIVGYGPAGVVAAGLLGQQRLKVYVAERLETVYDIPRAIALDHEVMRVFQQLGVAEAALEFCEPFTNSEHYGMHGQLIRRMTMVAPPYPQGYTPSMVFTQPEIEKILRARVAQMPNVTVALGVEMGSLTQTRDTVTLALMEGTSNFSIEAKYLLACDGGASTVRTQLGMPLNDLGFDEPWLVVDVLMNEQGLKKLPQVSVQYCEPERPCTLVIGPKNHRRWEISLRPDEDPKEVATPAATWKLLSRWISPEDGTLWRQSSYRFHALVAKEWRRGRVFLVGDAAHMQPPFLGQGMCQGIRDAANLAWKLGAVLTEQVQGQSAENLLESYGQERQAHVRELTSRIKHVGELISERDPERARLRDAKFLADSAGVIKDTPRQDILPRLNAGLLSTRHPNQSGALFPQPWLKKGSSKIRMDELCGHGWRLVLSKTSDEAASFPNLTVLQLGVTEELEGVVDRWYTEHQCTAALLRPDHYVFGTATGHTEIQDLLDEAAHIMGWSKKEIL